MDISDNNGEDCDYLVCPPISRPLCAPDNLVGHCATCRRMIQFRPHAPKSPVRICTACARKQKMLADEIVFTAETVKDFIRHVLKRRLS